MDPKKKRIYIAIIAVCILGSVGLWLWQKSSAPVITTPTVVTTPIVNNTVAPTPAVVAPLSDGSYPPPAVFPQNTTLDTSVFDSDANFKLLKAYNPASVDLTQLGRDDPFKNY